MARITNTNTILGFTPKVWFWILLAGISGGIIVDITQSYIVMALVILVVAGSCTSTARHMIDIGWKKPRGTK